MLDADFLNCRLPEGQSFTTIVKHKQIYVDKTDLIYKLALDRKPILLTRPRRFGKSTIVSTLEELFTHGVKPYVDADGNLKESYFKGLAIEKLWKEATTKLFTLIFQRLIQIPQHIFVMFALILEIMTRPKFMHNSLITISAISSKI